MQNDDVTQVVWIIRHGDRMDNHDPAWGVANAGTVNEKDTPLSPVGHTQAAEVARAILSDESADRSAGGPNGDQQFTVHHIVSSPYLRTIQSALPLYEATNIKLKLENSIWETGSRRPPPDHRGAGFPVVPETDYASAFTPTCGEHSKDFRPRLARAAAALTTRFPLGSGNVAIYSHADPVAYLATELSGVDPAVTAPVAPCSIFRLQRSGPLGSSPPFEITCSGGIGHLSCLGKTEPCHPIHKFHDWCAMFQLMREAKVVSDSFKWPPTDSEMPALQLAWADRYAKLLSGELKHAEPPPKVTFFCPTCGVQAFLGQDLLASGPKSHRVKCWKCKEKSTLETIRNSLHLNHGAAAEAEELKV